MILAFDQPKTVQIKCLDLPLVYLQVVGLVLNYWRASMILMVSIYYYNITIMNQNRGH